MATLEVHDGKSRVEYVTISRTAPALFGSDPKCDIVLSDPQALPIHGRLRWGRDKFQVEATQEAKALDINGKKVLKSSFRQGDELRIGSYRIFLLSADDAPAGDAKTRVQPKPAAVERLERGDWAKDVEAPQKKKPGAEAAIATLRTRRGGTASDATTKQPASKATTSAKRWWGRIVRALASGDAPPGQEKIATPLVIALAGVLAVLILLSYVFWGIISRRTTDNLYRHAVDNLTDGDYRNAMQDLDRFLAAAGPADPRAGKARVLRAMANVHQYTSGGSAVWSDAFTAAREMVKQVGKEDAYKDSSTELAEVVLKIAEGLADRAKANADPKVLAEAESAVVFHDRVGGAAAKSLRGRSRVPGKMAEARASVSKSQTRLKAIAAMDAAIKAKSAARIFDVRDALIAEYADLANDKAVVERMTRGNELLRLAVTFDPARRPAETAPRPDPLGPPTSVVLRATAPEAAAAPAEGSPPLVFALAEGFAYGLNGNTGAPVWHVPVGLSTPFPPQPIPGAEGSVLVYDARHEELIRLNAATGALVWRQATGERIADPPLFVGNQVIQATPTGKLRVLDMASGELRGTLDLHRPLARTPARNETGQYLYVLADESSLFVIAREPLSCVGVEYIGHDAGSIGCAPARMGRYLVIAENNALMEGLWRVYLLDEDGPKMRPIQRLAVPGWTNSTPAGQGSIIWMIGDRGGLAAYTIGPYDSKAPFQKVASIASESRPSGPAFARARTEREVWLASSRTARYDLDPQRGRVAAAWARSEAGPALAPIQVAGRLAVLTQQSTEGRGVALWGINPGTGAVVWRTVLGTAWPSGLSPIADGEGAVTVSLDGGTVTVTRAQLQAGGFVELTIPVPGTFRLPPGPLQRLEIEGLSLIVPSPDASQIYVREGTGSLRKIDLPTPLGAPPVAWGRDLVIPGDDGRVYLIDPKTGAATADPYVPPFDRAKPTHWMTPALFGQEAIVMCDTSGRVRRLVRQAEPRARLAASGEETNLGKPLVADPVSTGTALLVATSDNRIRALAGRDLSALGAWPFDAPRALGPLATGPFALAADTAGTLFGFGADGQRAWTVTLREGPPVGAPLGRDNSLWILTRDGTLQRRALADGAPLERFALGVLPAAGPIALGADLAIPVAPGTVRLLLAPPKQGAGVPDPSRSSPVHGASPPKADLRPGLAGRVGTAQPAISPVHRAYSNGLSQSRPRLKPTDPRSPVNRAEEEATRDSGRPTRPQGRAYYRCAESPVNRAEAEDGSRPGLDALRLAHPSRICVDTNTLDTLGHVTSVICSPTVWAAP